MTELIISETQKQAVEKFNNWFRDRNSEQIFRLFGYAGTGKTTLAKYFAKTIGNNVCYAAYTGKAADVMRKNGCFGAQTIHSLIYTTEIDKFGNFQFYLNSKSVAKNVDLVIIDECFVAGTKISTPSGNKNIEEVIPGDRILNASGIDIVVGTYKKEIDEIAEIKIGNTKIACSRNHRFFTKQGLVCADSLKPGDSIIRTESAMRLLQKDVFAKEKWTGKILFPELQCDLVDAISVSQSKNSHERGSKEKRRKKKSLSRRRLRGSNSSDRTIKKLETYPNAWGKRKTKKYKNVQRVFQEKKRKRVSTIKTATICLRSVGRRLENGTCSQNGDYRKRKSYALENRYSKHITKNSNRNRWDKSHISRQIRNGSPKKYISYWKRVDSVSILEPGNRRLDEYRDNKGRIFVYDLQAKSHSSFSVEGVLVHNCSMVDDKMANDLLSYGTKILVLGDPAQLPPIDGTGYFIKDDPDVMLTEIHRQAENNPIIAMATAIRKNIKIEYGNYGSSSVIKEIEIEDMLKADQVIVGKNDTRELLTKIYRSAKSFTSPYPQLGEKLICLKNDRNLGIFNGQMFTVIADPEHLKKDFLAIMVTAENSNKTYRVNVHKSFFDPSVQKPFWKNLQGSQEFYWGWIVSCHKSQGSQWDNVYVVDESHVFRENKNKWLYTAITRAANSVTIVS